MAIEKYEAFAIGFTNGLYSRLEKEDIPTDFSLYHFQYPEWIDDIEIQKKHDEKHIKQIRKEVRELGGSDLYDEKRHSLIEKAKEYKNFAERRDYLAGFWTGIIVKDYLKLE